MAEQTGRKTTATRGTKPGGDTIVASSFNPTDTIKTTQAPMFVEPKTSNLVTVKNTLHNPLTFSYGVEAIRLSPGQPARNLNRNLIGALPKGAVIIPS